MELCYITFLSTQLFCIESPPPPSSVVNVPPPLSTQAGCLFAVPLMESTGCSSHTNIFYSDLIELPDPLDTKPSQRLTEIKGPPYTVDEDLKFRLGHPLLKRIFQAPWQPHWSPDLWALLKKFFPAPLKPHLLSVFWALLLKKNFPAPLKPHSSTDLLELLSSRISTTQLQPHFLSDPWASRLHRRRMISASTPPTEFKNAPPKTGRG